MLRWLTVGYVQAMETVSRVVTYVESNLHRMSSNSLADGDILNMVGGDGGVQVDVVFYMVSNRKSDFSLTTYSPSINSGL